MKCRHSPDLHAVEGVVHLPVKGDVRVVATLRAFIESIVMKTHSVSPDHAGCTGTTSGAPEGRTVARCAHFDNRAHSRLISSSVIVASRSVSDATPERRDGRFRYAGVRLSQWVWRGSPVGWV